MKFYDYSDRRWTVVADGDREKLYLLGSEAITTTAIIVVRRFTKDDRQTPGTMLLVETMNSAYLLRTTCCESLETVKNLIRDYCK